MNRIFITGDTHGSLGLKRLSNKNFPIAKTLTKEDVVIICGDAGFMWNNSNEMKYWDDWTEDRPFTIISVFGNHSNYDLLRTIPISEWQGAKVRRVRPHVMYIETGEIFTFNDLSFFVMNGAASIDKGSRKEGKSWWPQEIPSYQEFEYAANNLRAYNMKVDYILSHTTSNRTIQKFDKWYPQFDPVTNFLDKFVEEEVDYKINFFGHFHQDRTIDERHILLYNDIIELLPNGEIKVVNN